MNRLAWIAAVTLLASTAHAGPFDNLAGNWRGQAEYVAKVNAVEDPAAHAVVDLFLTVEPGGKVTGRSPDNGCQLLGIAKQGSSATVYQVEASVSGCRATNSNGRYRGVIGVYPAKGTITFSVQMSQPGGLTGKSKWGTIASTMVR